MKKITVIGGSGFVGTHLCSHLSKLKIPFEILDLKKSQRFVKQTKIVDIRDSQSLRNKISGDVVVHLAAIHRDNVLNEKEYFETNVNGTKNIILECNKKKIKKLIFTSSVAVYGFADPDTNEDGIIKPFNNYGKTKYLAEKALRDWYKKNDKEISLIIIRPTVIFGEGNRGNVYNLINQIASGKFLMIGNGKNKKSLAYIGNFVPFLIKCIDTKVSYEMFNYIDKPDLDMNSFVLIVKKHLNLRRDLGFRLPYAVGIFIGSLFDVYSKLSRKNAVISSLRVKKFCSSTSFTTKNQRSLKFDSPYTLEKAIHLTLQSEFINPDPHREVFFTE